MGSLSVFVATEWLKGSLVLRELKKSEVIGKPWK